MDHSTARSLANTAPPAEGACAEAGRQMFFTFVGRYFAAEPRLPALPPGTACSICGSQDARLWQTSSGAAICLAQMTVTRKRRGRSSAAEPLAPAEDTRGMVSMADGTMAVAGPHVARIVTKLQVDALPLPSSEPRLEVTYSQPGEVSGMRRSIIASPPPPPFVAIIFGKNASFRTTITEHPNRIFLCGPEPVEIDRPYLGRLLALADKVGPKGVIDLIGARYRLARDEYPLTPRGRDDREADQERFRVLRQSNVLSLQDFMTLPPPSSPLATFLRQIEA